MTDTDNIRRVEHILRGVYDNWNGCVDTLQDAQRFAADVSAALARCSEGYIEPAAWLFAMRCGLPRCDRFDVLLHISGVPGVARAAVYPARSGAFARVRAFDGGDWVLKVEGDEQAEAEDATGCDGALAQAVRLWLDGSLTRLSLERYGSGRVSVAASYMAGEHGSAPDAVGVDPNNLHDRAAAAALDGVRKNLAVAAANKRADAEERLRHADKAAALAAKFTR